MKSCFLPKIKLHEFYNVSVDKCVEEFKLALQGKIHLIKAIKMHIKIAWHVIFMCIVQLVQITL